MNWNLLQQENNTKVLFNFLMQKMNRHLKSQVLRILAPPKQRYCLGFFSLISTMNRKETQFRPQNCQIMNLLFF